MIKFIPFKSETELVVYILMAIIVPLIATTIGLATYHTGGQAVWWGYPILCLPGIGLFGIITYSTRLEIKEPCSDEVIAFLNGEKKE